MAPPSLLARPLAALAAGLLVAGLVQAAPAAADEPEASPALSVAVTALGLAGGTETQPADLGLAPGSATLDLRITNEGPDDVAGLTVTSELVANGSVSAPDCDLTALPLVEGVTVLGPGASVTCSASVSGVAAGSTHQSTFTASGTVGDAATPISAGASFYATASEPAPVPLAAALTIAAPTSAIVGSSVTVTGSLRRGGQPYAASTVLERSLDGSSWKQLATVSSAADGVLSTSVTAASTASYRFRFDGDDTTLAATSMAARIEAIKGAAVLTASAPASTIEGSTFLVQGTIKRAGKAYATTTQLQRQVGGGSWTTVEDVTSGSTGALSASAKADQSAAYRFSYAGDASTSAATSPVVRVTVVAKQTVALTASLPTRVVPGTTIAVKGTIKRAGKAFKTTTQLQRLVDGSGTWSTLKAVKSSSKGALSTTVKADRSASYRYRYAGTSTISAGVSKPAHLTVAKATVRLTVNAPASVTKGKSIKVKGSIKREGKGYRTTTVLEFRTSGGWSTVKKVKSSSKGALSTSVKPSRSGQYRYRFTGNSTTAAGESGGDRVTVKPKPPAKPKPKAYKNCTALVKVYPHGVGRSGARDKGGDVTEFTRDTATYNKNKKSDRDKDGIACERH